MRRTSFSILVSAAVLLASGCTPEVESTEFVGNDKTGEQRQSAQSSSPEVASVTTTIPRRESNSAQSGNSQASSVLQSQVTQPSAPQTQVIQPPVLQPQIVHPQMTQPQMVQPQVSKPQIVQPQIAQPQVAQPHVNQPQTETDEDHAGYLLIPITPFSNMEKGYQATNPGFRAVLKDGAGRVIASGPLTMDAVINGENDGASRGSAYGRLVLKVGLKYLEGSLAAGSASGGSGKLSICMDRRSRHDELNCEHLTSDIDATDRPYQWFDMPVNWSANGPEIKIERYLAQTGEGGTSQQIALSVYHPAYGFAAPGKAFKDYQSPLVFDLGQNQKFDLIDVWDDAAPVSFDITGSGSKFRTGWVQGSDALLVLDINGNGVIDSGVELFGEYSHKAARQYPEKKSPLKGSFANGFAALAQYDHDFNGRIDAKDQVFAKLCLWKDQNRNGQTEPGELISLKDASIVSIGLAWKSTDVNGSPLLVAGNEVRMISSATLSNGRKMMVGDVWFMQRRSDSQVSMKGGAK